MRPVDDVEVDAVLATADPQIELMLVQMCAQRPRPRCGLADTEPDSIAAPGSSDPDALGSFIDGADRQAIGVVKFCTGIQALARADGEPGELDLVGCAARALKELLQIHPAPELLAVLQVPAKDDLLNDADLPADGPPAR